MGGFSPAFFSTGKDTDDAADAEDDDPVPGMDKATVPCAAGNSCTPFRPDEASCARLCDCVSAMLDNEFSRSAAQYSFDLSAF